MEKNNLTTPIWALIFGVISLTSCYSNIDVPTPTSTGVELTENPTEDALSVLSNHSYVTYGEFDEEFGHALGRRMQGTMTSPSMADVFVIDPSAVNKSNLMSTHELKTMIRRTESGEASVVLTKATFREFYDWAQLYVLGYLLMELENYHGDRADYDSPAAAPARRRVANVVRNAYIAGHQTRMLTRGATVNGMELDWEHVDSWPEEDQNTVMFDGFAQSGGNELFVMNAAATLNANAEVRHPQNDHEWGHKADAVTHWLNRQDAEKAKTRAGLKIFTRAVTRGGGNADISDMMSAQTKDFVFDYQCPNVGNTTVYTAHSAIKVQYQAYSAYDFGSDVEYYQVRQNITVMNDKIYSSPEGDSNWWLRQNDGDWVFARGPWMKRIDTKMWLEGQGTISIVSAAPLNANGTSSGSTSSGGSASTTIGSSDGVSIGVSAGMSGWNPTFSMSESFTHTESYSETTGTTWNTSTNWSTQDLATTCTQDNNSVTWQHNGNTPNDYNSTYIDNIKTLLKSTCVTDEQVLWKVDNPSGTYTLKASLNVVNEIAKLKKTDYQGSMPTFGTTQDNPHEISFELNAPDRFKRKWNCQVYDYGTTPEGMTQIEYTNLIDDFIEQSYGNKSACFCWAKLFVSTEATADGSDNAASVFQTFKNSIRGMKQQLRIKGISGRLVFGLKPDGVNVTDPKNLTDQITVVLDGTGYNEGETFTEQLNGYDITYKVTKKGSEVELSSVPNDFSGELNIPEKVSDGVLTVTSLGNNCAVRRKGITAVTIPSTVRTIENGALAELNITEISVPEGVETISTYVFHCDESVTKVYLPSTLKTIGNSSFGCTNSLAEVHIKATTPPDLGNFIFYPRYNDAVLYVPKGCKDAYAKAKEWQYFKNIVEE